MTFPSRLSVTLGLVAATMPCQAPTAEFRLAPVQPTIARLVFDSQRGIALALERPASSGRMWEWDGSAFRQHLGPTHDYAYSAAAVYDDANHEVITLDISPGLMRIWDGRAWRTAPLPVSSTNTWLSAFNFAFDSARQRLVAVFGWPQNPDVAEWDGTSWTVITPVTNPGHDGSLAYDPGRGRCVFATGDPMELWEWNGTDWSQFASGGPTGIVGYLSHDPGNNRLVYHGTTGAGPVTWTFDASGWQQIPLPADFPVSLTRLGYDGTGMMRFDGFSERRGYWRLEGPNWVRLAIDHPRVRRSPALAATPTGFLHFGGGVNAAQHDDTWWFDGAWNRRTPAVSPSPRSEAGMAWAPTSQTFVLYGGLATTLTSQTVLSDTWTFDGTNWTQQQPTTVPPARRDPIVLTDPGGTVLLLNTAPTSLNNDQWLWSGSDWINQPSFTPAAIAAPTAAAFDPVRGRVVALSAGSLSEWDGSSWTPANASPVVWSNGVHLVYRPETQRMLAFQPDQSQHHEWDGSSWTTISIPIPGQPYDAALVTDNPRGRVLSLYHVHSTTLPSDEDHAAVLTSVSAAIEVVGAGCALGAAPALASRGSMRPFAPPAELVAVTGAPFAPTVFGLGTATINVPLGGGCNLLVGSPIGSLFVAADGLGDAALTLVVPPDNTFLGVELVAQCGVVDPTNSTFSGITLSNALRIRIGQ